MSSERILKDEQSLEEQKVGSVTSPSLMLAPPFSLCGRQPVHLQSKASSMLMLMEDLSAKQQEIKQTEEQNMMQATRVDRTLAVAQELVCQGLSCVRACVCVRAFWAPFAVCTPASCDFLQKASREDMEDEDTHQTLEIYNQLGQKMSLLPGDQRAIKLGMTLHDRGRVLVKEGDYETALQLFLRAESEGFTKW